MFQELRLAIQHGYPERTAKVPQCVLPYYDIRGQLTIQDDLVFKQQQLVVTSIPPETLNESRLCLTHWYRSMYSTSTRQSLLATGDDRGIYSQMWYLFDTPGRTKQRTTSSA